MRFKNMSLVTPCKDCPFRTDVPRYLTEEKYAAIAESLIDRGEGFTCHKTNDFTEEGEAMVTSRSCECAGAMIFLEHVGKPNQCMQVMARLGVFDPSKLKMDAPVYRTRKEFEESIDG